MKILCNNASLCGAVTNVSKAVSERAALKSLEGIKFKLENSMLELTGYDLEIGIKTVIPVKSDDSGEFILNARLFAEMIRKMPSEEILIEVSENFQVTISGGVTTFNIPATSAEENPALPKKEEENKITISQPVVFSTYQSASSFEVAGVVEDPMAWLVSEVSSTPSTQPFVSSVPLTQTLMVLKCMKTAGLSVSSMIYSLIILSP